VVLLPAPKYALLEGVDISFMSEVSTRLDNFDMFSDTQDDLAMSIFGESVALGLDDTGRVLLPKGLSSFAGLSGSAAFVGMGNKFQIWCPEVLEARRDGARKNVQEQRLTLPKNAEGSE